MSQVAHFDTRNGSQVIERVGGYGGSNKLFPVERDTITEEQSLQPLLPVALRRDCFTNPGLDI
jgi:hypothetical protein